MNGPARATTHGLLAERVSAAGCAAPAGIEIGAGPPGVPARLSPQGSPRMRFRLPVAGWDDAVGRFRRSAASARGPARRDQSRRWTPTYSESDA